MRVPDRSRGQGGEKTCLVDYVEETQVPRNLGKEPAATGPRGHETKPRPEPGRNACAKCLRPHPANQHTEHGRGHERADKGYDHGLAHALPAHALLAHAHHRTPCLAEERTIPDPADDKLRDSRDHNGNPIHWMSPPLDSTTVRKLERWKVGWFQLFNCPTLQLSNSAVSVLPRMCG